MPKLTVFPLFTGFNLTARQFAALEALATAQGQTRAAVLRTYLEREADRLGLPRDEIPPQLREGVQAWRQRRTRGGADKDDDAA
jgi:hypothetical protein